MLKSTYRRFGIKNTQANKEKRVTQKRRNPTFIGDYYTGVS
jgi:hypothetical protein